MTGGVKKINGHFLKRHTIATFLIFFLCFLFGMLLKMSLALTNTFHTTYSAIENVIERETEQDLNHCLVFATLNFSVLKFRTHEPSTGFRNPLLAT